MCATNWWRKNRRRKKKRRELLKTATNSLFFFFFLKSISTSYTSDVLQMTGYFRWFLSTIWSHCKVSKEAKYCITYKNLKQGVFFCLDLFVVFFFLFVYGGKHLQFSIYNYFYVIALTTKQWEKKNKTKTQKKKRREKHTHKQICLSYSRDNHP